MTGTDKRRARSPQHDIGRKIRVKRRREYKPSSQTIAPRRPTQRAFNCDMDDVRAELRNQPRQPSARP